MVFKTDLNKFVQCVDLYKILCGNDAERFDMDVFLYHNFADHCDFWITFRRVTLLCRCAWFSSRCILSKIYALSFLPRKRKQYINSFREPECSTFFVKLTEFEMHQTSTQVFVKITVAGQFCDYCTWKNLEDSSDERKSFRHCPILRQQQQQ